MGAMKALYMDLEELHDHAADGLEPMHEWVVESGWVSPTEKEARNARAAKAVAAIEDADLRGMVSSIMAIAGVDISPVDFPIRNVASPVTFDLQKSA